MIFAVPLALLGAVVAVAVRSLDNSIYTQIGIVLLIALASKSTILIVEFVKNEVIAGKDIVEAAVHAAKTRLRPIFITSLTLMAGAMAIVRDPIFNGMAVTLLFGTGVATLFTLIVIPMGCISAKKRFMRHGCDVLDERLAEEDKAIRGETSA